MSVARYHFLADSFSASIVYKTSTRPWAIGKGVSGENNHVILNPGTDKERVAGGHYRPMFEGEVLVNNSGGGGGWGDPFERDTAAVLEDVLDGYVTRRGRSPRVRGRHRPGQLAPLTRLRRARLRAGDHPAEPKPVGWDTPGGRPMIEPDAHPMIEPGS